MDSSNQVVTRILIRRATLTVTGTAWRTQSGQETCWRELSLDPRGSRFPPEAAMVQCLMVPNDWFFLNGMTIGTSFHD